MEGHMLAPLLSATPPEFPFVALLVSGGHSQLMAAYGIGQYELLGESIDDAAGEAFDKVARLLGLAYPGGPSIQATAEMGDPRAFQFPRARLEGTWDFSFSGLKTAVLRIVRKMEEEHQTLPVNNLAASFQAAVVDVLLEKTLDAAKEYSAREVLVAGGVSANKALREAFLSRSAVKVHIPHISLCTDNAAMIATAGYFRFVNGVRDPLDLDAMPNWRLA
jgi:N6-L-threonylcarbamoyladenine synthase